MNYITLKNGYKIPNIAFGAARCDDKNGCEAVIKAITNGFRLIDNATVYPSKNGIFEGVKKCIDDDIVKRQEIVIAHKISIEDLGYNNTVKIVEKCIDDYNFGYLDIVLIHHPMNYNPYWKRYVIDTYRALESLYQKGKIKVIGVSNFDVEHLEFLKNYARIQPIINQIEFHPHYQQTRLVEYCNSQNICLEAFSPLLYCINDNLLKEIGYKYNKTPAQIALKWSIQRGFIPISSSKIESQIKENINIEDFVLSNEDIEYINSLDGGMYSFDFERIKAKQTGADLLIKTKEADNYVKKYKLFNFFTFLTKTKETRRITKYKLFGIPFCKVDTKYPDMMTKSPSSEDDCIKI